MSAMRAQSAVGLWIRNKAVWVCIGCPKGRFLGSKTAAVCSADDVKKLKLNAESSSVSSTDVGTTKEPNKEESVDVATAMESAVAQLNASSPRCAQCLAACDAQDDSCVQKCQDPTEATCEICPAGTFSEGGTASECTPCKRGAPTLAGPHTIASCALRRRADCKHGCSGVGVGLAGFFQSQREQFACINCDDTGDYYQEDEGRTVCSSCPLNTRRYAGQGSGANRTSCMCREEYWRHDRLLGKRCFKCPEGGTCEVTPSARAHSFVPCVLRLCLVGCRERTSCHIRNCTTGHAAPRLQAAPTAAPLPCC